MAIIIRLLIITLNLNGLNAPIKRHKVAEWIREHDSQKCHKRPTSEQKTYTPASEGLGKNIPSKWKGKKSRCIRQNRLQNKGHKRDTEGHFILPKGRIHQEDINIVNIYAPNIGAPNT